MANGTYSESISVNLLFPVYSNVLSDFNYSQIIKMAINGAQDDNFRSLLKLLI